MTASPTVKEREARPDIIIRLFYCGLVALCWGGLFVWLGETRISDPDIWWHIKTGEWIHTYGSVPTVDPFSHTFAGKPWIAKEWLSQLIFFWAFSLAGWNGVMLVTIAAVMLAAGGLFWVLSEDLSPLHAALASILGLYLASFGLTARPHVLSLVCVVLWTYQLFRASGELRAPRYGLLLIIVLWANLHAAFTIGLLIAVVAFLDFIERARLSRTDELLKWIGFLLLCPLVTILHPYGWNALLATWLVMGPNEAVPMIGEWQAFTAPDNRSHEVALLVLLFAALATGFRLGLAKALLLVLLLHLFLTHLRFAVYAFVVMPILLAPEMALQFPRLSAARWRAGPRDAIETVITRHRNAVGALAASVFALLVVLQVFVLPAAPPEAVSASSAIRHVKAHGITGNVMNDYNFGGPLVFNAIPTFIDGRTDQLFRDGFSRAYMIGPLTEESMRRVLAEYAIRWTIFPPADPRVAILDKLAGWRRVFADEFAVVHQAEAGAPP